MRQSLINGYEPNFQKLVIFSLVLHLVLISILFIQFKTQKREFKSYYVSLVEPARIGRGHTPATGKKKKVETAESRIAVKKKVASSKKAVTKKSKVAAKKSIKKTPAIKPERSEKSDEIVSREIERLRAIRELSKRKKDDIVKKTEAINIIRKRIKGSSVKGLGIPGKGEQIDPDSYYAKVTEKIWREWIYPDFETAGLEVIISIKIDRTGKVVSYEVEESSGNIPFDRSAINAISKASPLPMPMVELEIGVRFYL